MRHLKRENGDEDEVEVRAGVRVRVRLRARVGARLRVEDGDGVHYATWLLACDAYVMQALEQARGCSKVHSAELTAILSMREDAA